VFLNTSNRSARNREPRLLTILMKVRSLASRSLDRGSLLTVRNPNEYGASSSSEASYNRPQFDRCFTNIRHEARLLAFTDSTSFFSRVSPNRLTARPSH